MLISSPAGAYGALEEYESTMPTFKLGKLEYGLYCFVLFVVAWLVDSPVGMLENPSLSSLSEDMSGMSWGTIDEDPPPFVEDANASARGW